MVSIHIKAGRSRLIPAGLICFLILFYAVTATASAQGPAVRVISLSPIITETIFLLGAGDQLIGDTTYCTQPPEADKKEKIGSVTQVNVEKIISLRPDLVITSALTREKQIKILKAQGIRIMEIANPKVFDQMCALTRKIGAALGRTKEAENIIKTATADVNRVREQVKDFSPRRVFIQIGLKPLHTVNKDMFINEFIVLSNAVNIAEDQPSGVFSREKVIEENPDVILVATMGSSKKAAVLEKERWMGFPSLKATQTHEIHVLDPEAICSPTPASFAQGLEQVAALIHPRIKDRITDTAKGIVQ